MDWWESVRTPVWLISSVVGLLSGVRLVFEAMKNLRAATHAQREGSKPARLVPLARGYVWAFRLATAGFLLFVLAGLVTVTGFRLYQGAPALVVEALILGNGCLALTLLLVAQANRTALAAIVVDDHALDLAVHTNTILQRMEAKDADVAEALAITLENAPTLETITATVQDTNAVAHRLEGTEAPPEPDAAAEERR